jgi:ornithine decarboxylase
VGSDWPLSGKFGAQPQEAEEIIALAAELKADLAGVTFHVGSQCRNADNWRAGIESAKRTMRKMRLRGLKPRLLNIGGGFPVRHTKPIPSIEVIGEVVNRALAGLPEGVRVMAEPGRYLVSDAGWFVCRVAGTATRSGKRWAYFDAGMFGGIIETTEGLQYEVHTDRTGRLIPWTVAGPTCDSVDVVMRDQLLPEDLTADDLVYIPNAAAYTTAYASNFNGFPLPEVRILSA